MAIPADIILASKFGNLQPVAEVFPSPSGKRSFLCQCECGATKEVYMKYLRNGDTTSCGCVHNNQLVKRNTTHGLAKTSPYYITWKGIKARCFNKKHERYGDYGGRGITMHKQWKNDFESFHNYMVDELGQKPAGHSLDRMDNDGNYEPNNLRWATASQQNFNRRCCK